MRFEFGKNWQSYSKNVLSDERIEQARKDFQKLVTGIQLKGRTFLDIGFGQGLSLLIAKEMGAKVVGIDIDENNIEALKVTMEAMDIEDHSEASISSILDDSFMAREKEKGGYDIVHSWGVLHHTGDMRNAINNACALVKEDGFFICAIYNRHWSAPLWKVIKYIFNISPQKIQNLYVRLFYPIIYTAKLIVTRKNPLKKERGMDFYHDVVDWVGGYPYEYASIKEINEMVSNLGFELIKSFPARVPTGCNEYVFKKIII